MSLVSPDPPPFFSTRPVVTTQRQMISRVVVVKNRITLEHFPPQIIQLQYTFARVHIIN